MIRMNHDAGAIPSCHVPTGTGESHGSLGATDLPENDEVSMASLSESNALDPQLMDLAWITVVKQTMATVLANHDEPSSDTWAECLASWWPFVMNGEPEMVKRAFRTLVEHTAHHRPAWRPQAKEDPHSSMVLDRGILFQMMVGWRKAGINLGLPEVHAQFGQEAFMQGVLNAGCEGGFPLLVELPAPTQVQTSTIPYESIPLEPERETTEKPQEQAPTVSTPVVREKSESQDDSAVLDEATISPEEQSLQDAAYLLAQRAVDRLQTNGKDLDEVIRWFGTRIEGMADQPLLVHIDALRRVLAERITDWSRPLLDHTYHEKQQLNTEYKKTILRVLRDHEPSMSEERQKMIVQGLIHPTARCADFKKTPLTSKQRLSRWSLPEPAILSAAHGLQALQDAIEVLAHRVADRIIDEDNASQDALSVFQQHLTTMNDAQIALAVGSLRTVLSNRVPGAMTEKITLDLLETKPSAGNKDLESARKTSSGASSGMGETVVVEPSRVQPDHTNLDVQQLPFKPCRTTSVGFESSERFKVLAENAPLRTVGMNPWAWQDAMDRSFPWMSDLTARLVRRMSIQVADNLPLQLPTLALLGEPGIGKTMYWIEAMRLLAHPFIVQGMAGMHDSMAIKGSPAGWNMARPSIVATTMASLTCGNPVILLDELDKAGGSERNGHAMEALLPMLEQETADQYYDECLQQVVDASRISWVVTINDETRLIASLRSRMEVIEVKGPDWTNPEHVNAALTLGEQRARAAWPTARQNEEIGLSEVQKDGLRRTRWNSLRSLGQAIRVMVEENLYHASIDKVVNRRPLDAWPSGWRPESSVNR